MFIGVIGWIVLGLIAGFIVGKFLNQRGDDPNMGIAFAGGGALIGGWLFSLISGTPVSEFNLRSLMYAGIAAFVVLIVWHAMRKHSFSKY